MPKKHLLKCIVRAFRWEYLLTFVTCLFGAVFQYAAPFLVHMIIEFLQDETEDKDTSYGLTLLGILAGSQAISFVIFNHMLYYQVMIGVASTNCLIASIYQK